MANAVEPRYVVVVGGGGQARRGGQGDARPGGRPGLQRDRRASTGRLSICIFCPPTPLAAAKKRVGAAGVAALQPRSRGHMPIMSRSLKAKPLIDHRFLGDAAGHDAPAPTAGMEQLPAMAAGPGPAELAGADSCRHPLGTCKTGPADDTGAVVDLRGRLHRVAGCTASPGSGSRWKTNNLIEPLQDARCSNVGLKFSL